jgi:hypothetical protein
MTSIQQSSLYGSLFELVARGKKDGYFVRDNDDSYLPFNGAYDPVAPFLKERRTFVPLNASPFGNTFEVEIEPYGDILKECTLLIDLPSWFPPLKVLPGTDPVDPIQANSYYWIKGTDGISYGYVNYIGYLLFEKIQFYQDQILIDEYSGDALLATSLKQGSWNSSFLDQTVAGVTQDDDRSMAFRATPRRLRVSLPLPGMQCKGDGGFPLCAMTNQTYRLRIKMRKLEDLVVSSDRQIKPQPWSVPGFTYTMDGGQNVVFQPLSRPQIGQPTVLLETIQVYVDLEVQAKIRQTGFQIPFRRTFENIFTFGEKDYAPIDRGSTATVTRRLDGRHPTERLVFFFRTQDAIDRNQLSNFLDPSGLYNNFYSNVKLVIAGQDREYYWEPFVWRELEELAKDERDTGLNFGEIGWHLGDVYERERPYSRQPEGTVNFTTADRPTIYVELQNVPRSETIKQRGSEMRVFTQGWALYEIQNGRGHLVFAN